MNCTCSPRRRVVFATPAQQMSDQHGSWEMKLVAGFAVLEMSFNYRGSRGHNVWLTLTAGAYARFHVIDMASVRSTYQVQLPGPEGVFFGPHRNGCSAMTGMPGNPENKGADHSLHVTEARQDRC